MRRYLPIAFAVIAALIVILLKSNTIGGSSPPSVTSTPRSSPGDVAVRCDLFVSPSGSDHASGLRDAPKATIVGLDNALHPGQTGCLLTGDYGSIHTTSQLRNSGQPGARITIRTAPHQHAKLIGLIALQGSYTTLSHLNIDGSNTSIGSPDPHRVSIPVLPRAEITARPTSSNTTTTTSRSPPVRANGIGVGWNGRAGRHRSSATTRSTISGVARPTTT